jgi:hypothetical protein
MCKFLIAFTPFFFLTRKFAGNVVGAREQAKTTGGIDSRELEQGAKLESMLATQPEFDLSQPVQSFESPLMLLMIVLIVLVLVYCHRMAHRWGSLFGKVISL